MSILCGVLGAVAVVLLVIIITMKVNFLSFYHQQFHFLHEDSIKRKTFITPSAKYESGQIIISVNYSKLDCEKHFPGRKSLLATGGGEGRPRRFEIV